MFHRLMIAGVALFLLAAYTAYQTGQQPMNRAQVDSIQKGGTTRAQVDAYDVHCDKLGLDAGHALETTRR